MGKDYKYKYEELDYDFPGTGYVIIGVGKNEDPELLYVRKGTIEDSYELTKKGINGLIKEARTLAEIPKKEKIFIDTEGLINPDYVHSEGELFEPEGFTLYDCDPEDLESFAEYCSDLY